MIVYATTAYLTIGAQGCRSWVCASWSYPVWFLAVILEGSP
jgi:hypothetical protein